MKDWKAECDRLRGVLQEREKTIQMLRSTEESRIIRAEELRDKFKELLIEVLGR
jgi:hypothetical protein